MTLSITGKHTPMSHQAEDVAKYFAHPRINMWNGLGTGKMNTGAWLALEWYLSGAIDEVFVVCPSMCGPDWMETFESKAWPEHLASVVDARPPNHVAIRAVCESLVRLPPGQCHVFVTTYAGMRAITDGRNGRKVRYKLDGVVLERLAGRRALVIYDESQAAAIDSQQGNACRSFAASCKRVVSMTATPIGNPLQMRLWGMTSLTRPDVLARVPEFSIYGVTFPNVVRFAAFKARYGVLVDPTLRSRRERNQRAMFNLARAYPRGIETDLLSDEILKPMIPITSERRKEDCLDLPEKVYMRRSYTLPRSAERAMQDLVEDDRAVLESGHVVTVENPLVERLRTIELTGGFLDGQPLHTGKLDLLRDVLAELRDNLGDKAPILIWASRSRELLACGMVAAGVKPKMALEAAGEAYVRRDDETWVVDGSKYRYCLQKVQAGSAAVIHGPTPTAERDAIQSDWRAGRIHTVAAHPGVAGAGLNWQHVRATIYFSPPLGVIARRQSEDRVHRRGLKHTALYYDLVAEGGPDEAVYQAHRDQTDAAIALLDWMRDR